MKNMILNVGNYVGNFKIESGKVIVTDPCYEIDEQNILENVKNGNWNIFLNVVNANSWGKRVKEIIVQHDSCNTAKNWENAKINVGVDSGQAGIYDVHFYRDDSVVDNMTDKDRMYTEEKICENEPWYSWNCDRTLSKEFGGSIPFGAVSSSGFGDGCYDCFYQQNEKGEIDAIKIVFINDDEL